ncbi:MAG: 2-C-methyl-D-erythritol 4-phosphate cytidylyltransferase [Candidatus Omnitrophica bacterium]|nr:2-C-methyl-D-erythritol 4-phosphate cytidylyltransferase [Candidatus Omnitrophota bacterium]
MVAAVIVAGGVGRRLKSRVHKPFVRLAGRPMLARTLGAFERSAGVDGVVLVVYRGDLNRARALVRRYRCRKVLAVVPGGETRMDSVGCGLQALPASARWVAVHDSARPLIAPREIEAVLRAARASRAAIVAVPVIPTIKEGKNGWVTRTLDRNRLWAVQTPQVFERKLLERAHAKGRAQKAAATDDAALVERLGVKVRIVPGSPKNIKVTTPEDLRIAEVFLKK